MNYIHCLEIKESTIEFAKKLSLKNKCNVGIISPTKTLEVEYEKEKEKAEQEAEQEAEETT